MERWILAIGYSKERFNATQRECLNYDVFIRMATYFAEAINEVAKAE